MNEISLKAAKIEDAGTVTCLAGSLFMELGLGSSIPDEGEMTEKCRYLLVQDDQYHAFLAKDENGSAIGLITLHENDALFSVTAFAEIMEFYITPDFRSKGLGKRMLEETIHFANKMKWSHLALNAPPKNLSPATIKFYEREGFTHKGPYMGRKLN